MDDPRTRSPSQTSHASRSSRRGLRAQNHQSAQAPSPVDVPYSRLVPSPQNVPHPSLVLSPANVPPMPMHSSSIHP
eukprot:1440449-Amphidinium_carterae.2